MTIVKVLLILIWILSRSAIILLSSELISTSALNH